MPYDYEILPKAQKHLEDSTEWYSYQNPDLAEDFISHFENGISKICNESVLTRKKYKQFLHFLLVKYPYTIIYTVDEIRNLITVRSIYHQKRNSKNKYR